VDHECVNVNVLAPLVSAVTLAEAAGRRRKQLVLLLLRNVMRILQHQRARARANIIRANVISDSNSSSNASNRLEVGRRQCLIVQSLAKLCFKAVTNNLFIFGRGRVFFPYSLFPFVFFSFPNQRRALGSAVSSPSDKNDICSHQARSLDSTPKCVW